jgi:uncharacterized SAM-binding protein YcdF (DUF218 family)
MSGTFIKRALVVSLISVVSLGFQSCVYTSKTGTILLRDAEKKKYDMVIVPGLPFENGNWSYAMKGRVYWSVYLYKKGIAQNIMYSGGAVYSPYIEAEIMALYAEKLGVPRSHIYTETFAQHSTENIYYGFRKARQLGFLKVALASDPFQTKMLRKFARNHVDPLVGMIPMVTDTMKAIQPFMIDPEIDFHEAFDPEFTLPLHEKEGFRKRFRGTRGMAIDTSYYSK